MPDEPPARRPRDPAADADEGRALLAALRAAAPVPPLDAAESARLRDLMVRAAAEGDAGGLARLQALADNPAGLRELFARFPADPAG